MFIVRKGEVPLLSRRIQEAASRLLERHDGTPIELRFWGGERLRFGAGAPALSVTFRTRRGLRHPPPPGTLGVRGAYIYPAVTFGGGLAAPPPAASARSARKRAASGAPATSV